MGTIQEVKYPLDQNTFKETIDRLIQHDSAIRSLLQKQHEEPIIAEIEEENELSVDELSKVFKERGLKEMSIGEIDAVPINKLKDLIKKAEEDEVKEENSNDIYRIKARVANLARGPGMSLTPQGEMLCNSFVHVLKALYDFADTLQDGTIKAKLVDLIRKQEGMPGNLIASAGAGVTMDKRKK